MYIYSIDEIDTINGVITITNSAYEYQLKVISAGYGSIRTSHEQ